MPLSDLPLSIPPRRIRPHSQCRPAAAHRPIFAPFLSHPLFPLRCFCFGHRDRQRIKQLILFAGERKKRERGRKKAATATRRGSPTSPTTSPTSSRSSWASVETAKTSWAHTKQQEPRQGSRGAGPAPKSIGQRRSHGVAVVALCPVVNMIRACFSIHFEPPSVSPSGCLTCDRSPSSFYQQSPLGRGSFRPRSSNSVDHLEQSVFHT